jgi:hypothetical protein
MGVVQVTKPLALEGKVADLWFVAWVEVLGLLEWEKGPCLLAVVVSRRCVAAPP